MIPRMLAGAGAPRNDADADDAEPGMIDATERLAVVDQEWQHLRAVDLLVVLRSFAPKSGEVLKVTVYPSDFGLKRMAEEARHGPLAAFGKTAGGREDGEGEGEEEEEETGRNDDSDLRDVFRDVFRRFRRFRQSV